MSLDTPKYLSELFTNIRGRSIAWDAQFRAGLIPDSDVRKIKAIDKVPREKQVSLVENDVDGYAALILGPGGVLKKATDGKRVDIVAYMLVLLVDLLEGVCKPFVFFLPGANLQPRPYECRERGRYLWRYIGFG
jgi:V-type H+-transporting ATPase subunit H